MLTQLAERWPLLAGLLDFVFPMLCAGCGEYTESADGICPRCLARIDWYSSPFELYDQTRSADDAELGRATSALVFPLFAGGDYVDPFKLIVIQFKFHGVRTMVDAVASRLIETYREKLEQLQPFTLVPVPLHPSREYVRGYNQAEVFAAALQSHFACDLDTSLIVRTTKRRPQARLKQADRERNVRGVFEATGQSEGSSKSRLILVDDVVTSGSTIREARRVLCSAGHNVIGAISMAHGV